MTSPQTEPGALRRDEAWTDPSPGQEEDPWAPGAEAEAPSSSVRLLLAMMAVVTVVVSIPSTSIYYVAPFLGIACFLLNVRTLRRMLALTLGLAALTVTTLAIDSARGRSVNPGGPVVGYITYAPWWMLFSLRPVATGKVPDRQWRLFVALVAIYVIVQSLFGIAEYMRTLDGDMVSGTFGFLNFLEGKKTISQVFFTFTMIAGLLLLACYPRSWLNLVALGLGSLTVMIAQSGHQTLLLLVSIPLVMALAYQRFSLLLKGVVILLVGVAGVHFVNPHTWDVARSWFGQVALSDRSMKKQIVRAAGSAMSDPKNMVFGTGLGQFSSKAALISAAEYGADRLPGWIQGRSDYYRDGVELELPHFRKYGAGSAMAQPFCSAVSVPVEFGIPVTLVLLYFFVRAIRRNNLRARAGGEAGRLAVASSIGMVLFLLCCGVENYAEMVQALTIPLLLMLLVGMRIRHCEDLPAESPPPPGESA